MKKLIRIPIIASLLLLVSCIKEIDMGFPKTITFTKEGGEKVFYGTHTLCGLYIMEGAENKAFSDRVDGIEIVQYDWLTVKSPENSEILIITVEPSDKEISRKLVVEGHSGPVYTRIVVKQK